MTDTNKVTCDECGSNEVVKCGKRWRKLPNDGRVRDVQMFSCKNCGKIFRVKPIEEANNGTEAR
jgi:transposase-like protein